MDINSLFRSFFHINPGHSSEEFSPPNHRRSQLNDDIIFNDNFENFDSHFKIFEQMEDIFSNMFSSSFGVIGFPRFAEFESLPSQPTNPRSLMIKDSEEEHSSLPSAKKFEDSMFSLLDESGKQLGKMHSFSYSKFSSVKTVHLPDGTVEEHRTVIDNEGNKTTTVRRSIGDTSHEITTKSDKQGIKEKEENFMNMDENELTNFDEKWNKLKNGNTVNPEVPSISLTDTNPSYLHYLKKFFGPFQKEELK